MVTINGHEASPLVSFLCLSAYFMFGLLLPLAGLWIIQSKARQRTIDKLHQNLDNRVWESWDEDILKRYKRIVRWQPILLILFLVWVLLGFVNIEMFFSPLRIAVGAILFLVMTILGARLQKMMFNGH
jgi:hypothetical protein